MCFGKTRNIHDPWYFSIVSEQKKKQAHHQWIGLRETYRKPMGFYMFLPLKNRGFPVNILP